MTTGTVSSGSQLQVLSVCLTKVSCYQVGAIDTPSIPHPDKLQLRWAVSNQIGEESFLRGTCDSVKNFCISSLGYFEKFPTPSPTYSAKPSVTPSLMQTPMPTSVPSTEPTEEETVRVTIGWRMQASGSPSVEDMSALRTTIAARLSIPEATGMKNFDVGFEEADRRRLLVGGTWVVTFDIITDIYSAADTTTSAVARLQNATFQTELQTEIPGIESFEVASAFVRTRNPSEAPTPAPTVTCKSGTYLDEDSGLCTDCEVGKYAVNDNPPWARECTPCAAGRHQNSTGASTCIDCAAGRYSTSTGASSCSSLCAAGTYSARGATECTNCESGKTSEPGSSGCVRVCSAGEYDNKGTCTACRAGQYQTSTASRSCIECEAGKYSSSTGRSSACSDLCAAGTYSADTGRATACTDLCVAGKYARAGSVACDECSAGKYMPDEGAGRCRACRPGKYCAGRGSTEQTPCEPGKNSEKKSSWCTQCTNRGWCLEGTCIEGHKGLACDMCDQNYFMASG